MAFPFFTPRPKPVSVAAKPVGNAPTPIVFKELPETQQILLETEGQYVDLVEYLLWRLRTLDQKVQALESF